MVKNEEIETSKSSTIVQKSKNVVKTNVASSSTAKQENINDAINVQKSTVQNNVDNNVNAS